MKLIVVDRKGARHDLAAQPGVKMMEVIRDAGLSIAAQCGGCCSCATCHVYVDDEWAGRVPPMTGEEEAMLELAIEVQPSSRLSCQITAAPELDGLKLTLAPGTDV